jgi:glutamate synthase (NADPH/NADH) small chain
MDYLTQQNRMDCGDAAGEHFINAKGKHVVVIGGGDTGSDCVGTANRQGAKSVTQFDIHVRPPEAEDEHNAAWPLVPTVYMDSSSHEEGCRRMFTMVTQRFMGDDDGNVCAIEAARLNRPVRSEERATPHLIKAEKVIIPADLVLISVGFAYPEYQLLRQLEVETTKRGTLNVSKRGETSQPGVFAAGDCSRGASLVVWAIAEGRAVARTVDEYLMGESNLPNPLRETIVIDYEQVLTLA